MRSSSLLITLLISSFALAEPAPPRLASQVPPTAVAALLVERDATDLLRKMVDGRPALRTELAEYLQRKLAFDPFTISGLAAWVESYSPPRVSVYLRGPRLVGTPDLAPVVVSTANGGILLTMPAPPASAAQPTALGKLLADADKAEVVLAIVDFGIDPSSAAMAQQYKIEAARVMLQKSMARAELVGDPQKLETIGKMIIGGLAMASEKLAVEREKALAAPGTTAEGVAAIWSYHQLRAAQKELEPRIVGNRLVFEYKLPELGQLSATAPVAAIGVAAAIAIPAFTKYIRRSKASEPRTMLPRIANGLATKVAEQKGKLRLPPSTDWTPSQPCALQPEQKCTGIRGGAWKDIGFEVTESHYYQYRLTITTTGKGSAAQTKFKVEAQGDLDGDGLFAHFWMEGTLGADRQISWQPLQVENELE